MQRSDAEYRPLPETSTGGGGALELPPSAFVSFPAIDDDTADTAGPEQLRHTWMRAVRRRIRRVPTLRLRSPLPAPLVNVRGYDVEAVGLNSTSPPASGSPQGDGKAWTAPRPRRLPMPVTPPSPPLDLKGLSRMEDFVAEKGAAAPVAADQPSSARGLLVLSARRLAKGITAAVLPKKGYVKGVADRWDEAHLTPPPSTRSPTRDSRRLPPRLLSLPSTSRSCPSGLLIVWARCRSNAGAHSSRRRSPPPPPPRTYEHASQSSSRFRHIRGKRGYAHE